MFSNNCKSVICIFKILGDCQNFYSCILLSVLCTQKGDWGNKFCKSAIFKQLSKSYRGGAHLDIKYNAKILSSKCFVVLE